MLVYPLRFLLLKSQNSLSSVAQTAELSTQPKIYGSQTTHADAGWGSDKLFSKVICRLAMICILQGGSEYNFVIQLSNSRFISNLSSNGEVILAIASETSRHPNRSRLRSN
jgi:hypothetical protein